MKRIQTKKGYITNCSFCPAVIDTKNEPNGFLYTSRGKPICAVCRVLKKTHSRKLLMDRKESKKEAIKEERERVEAIAQASQEGTDSQIK